MSDLNVNVSVSPRFSLPFVIKAQSASVVVTTLNLLNLSQDEYDRIISDPTTDAVTLAAIKEYWRTKGMTRVLRNWLISYAMGQNPLPIDILTTPAALSRLPQDPELFLRLENATYREEDVADMDREIGDELLNKGYTQRHDLDVYRLEMTRQRLVSVATKPRMKRVGKTAAKKARKKSA